MDYNSNGVGFSGDKFLPKLNGTFGFEYMVSQKVGLSVSSGWNYYLSDSFDGSHSGHYNDSSWGFFWE